MKLIKKLKAKILTSAKRVQMRLMQSSSKSGMLKKTMTYRERWDYLVTSPRQNSRIVRKLSRYLTLRASFFKTTTTCSTIYKDILTSSGSSLMLQKKSFRMKWLKLSPCSSLSFRVLSTLILQLSIFCSIIYKPRLYSKTYFKKATNLFYRGIEISNYLNKGNLRS